MHIFISYAKVDTQPLARKIRDTLRAINGLTAWMDESLESGEDWAVQIQDEIDRCDLMLVLMSPDVNRSTEPRSFVLREIHYAQDNRKPILPVLAQKTRIPVQLAGIQFLDLTQNQAAAFDTLIENICRRAGVLSPAEQERQKEEIERQRVAELHRQALEAEQKRQAELATQRQAEEQERQQQNAQTTPSMPIARPQPNAPQNWDKQYSEGAQAAYQAKVSAAPKRSTRIPLIAVGAVAAALVIIAVVGLVLSNVLGGDDEKANRQQLKFEDDSIVHFAADNSVCAFYNLRLGDDAVGKELVVKLESTDSIYEQVGDSKILFWQLYLSDDQPWEARWTVNEENGTKLTGTDYADQTLTWTIEKPGDYVICLQAGYGNYPDNLAGDKFWFTWQLL